MDAVRGERIAVAPQSLGLGVHRGRVAHVADPPVPAREQPRGGVVDPAVVLQHDRVGDEVARRPVDGDDGGAEVALALEVGLVVGDGNEQQRADALREQGIRHPLLTLGGVVRRRDQEGEAVRRQLLLDPRGDLVVEGVAELAHDEAEGVRRAPAAEAPRQRVRPEPKPLGGGQHALDRLGRDQLAVREDARHRLRTHAREPRDIVERRTILHRHRCASFLGMRLSLAPRDEMSTIGHFEDIERDIAILRIDKSLVRSIYALSIIVTGHEQTALTFGLAQPLATVRSLLLRQPARRCGGPPHPEFKGEPTRRHTWQGRHSPPSR